MAFTLTGFAASAAAAGLLPSAVHEFAPGQFAGFGAANFPANVLSGPDGGPMPPSEPNERPEEVFTLGELGAIVLRWDGHRIIDGAGPDFIVFENVLQQQATSVPFVEAGVVSVSQDGETWVTFPFQFLPPDGWNESNPFAIPLRAESYEGLAGVHPTLTTPQNGIDPADASQSGGDAFDLAVLGLPWVRYVRIQDAGSPLLETALRGTNGLPIWDLGTTVGGGNTAGFDLDTVIAIHHEPMLLESTAWLFY